MTDKRKFERLPARLEVEIRSRGRGQVCPSIDVSRHGAFLATANPPLERQLLILRIPLLDALPPIDVMASVARRVSAEEALARNTVTGIGISFFALTEENKQRWEQLLSKLRGDAPRAPLPATEHPSRATFLLQPKDVDRLRLFAGRELALGTMFLRTPVLRPVGENLKIVVLHPLSDEELPLLARVRSVHEGSITEPKGMTLDFEPLAAELRGAVSHFVEQGEALPLLNLEAPTTATATAPPSAGEEKPSLRPPPLPRKPEAADEVRGELVEEPISEELAAAAAGLASVTAPPQELLTDADAGLDERLFSSAPVDDLPPDDEPPPPRPEAVEVSAGDEAIAAVEPPTPAPAPSVANNPTSDEASRQSISPATLPPAPNGHPSAPEDPAVFGLRAALLASPEDVSILFRLGSALARHPGTAPEALQVLQKLQIVEPHHPLANGTLALAYAQLGQRSAAERHLTRARRLGQPVDARVRALLGEAV